MRKIIVVIMMLAMLAGGDGNRRGPRDCYLFEAGRFRWVQCPIRADSPIGRAPCAGCGVVK